MSECGTVEVAVESLRKGEMVVVVDSPDRENEGDVVMAAEHVTDASVNFMAKHARGLVCVAMRRERLDELAIAPMAATNEDSLGTAFHVSVDHGRGTTTGISAQDRARTIRGLASPDSVPSDFNRPGHVLPLAAREGGVLTRAGHTEAAVDLMTLAGLQPAGVICEVMRDDGAMERLSGLVQFARRHELPILAISDLIAHRLRTENLVSRAGVERVTLGRHEFEAITYRDHQDVRHLALVLGDLGERGDVPVHIKSECLTGDVFGSRSCACGEQLERALRMIEEEGSGVLVYLRGQEGETEAHTTREGDHNVAEHILRDLGVAEAPR